MTEFDLDDENLVTLDDRILGIEGKYVGKKEVEGYDHPETVYKIYYVPPIARLKAIQEWFKGKLPRSKTASERLVKKYPRLVPESAIHENQPTPDTDAPGIADKRTVLLHDVDEEAPWTESLDQKVDTRASRLSKEKKRASQTAAKSKSEAIATKNEQKQEKDKNRRGGRLPSEMGSYDHRTR